MEKRGCLIAKLADTALISVVKQAIQVIAQQEADRLQLLWADRSERLQLAPYLSAPLTIDRDRDKNPVVALREIADGRISPEDLKEDLIHSLQKHVDVDEPEAESVPLIGSSVESTGDDTAVEFDRMTEEDLLRGLDGLVPPAESDDDSD